MTHSFVMTTIFLDVSQLPAPEPFHLILERLATMDKSQYLIVNHRKQPILLYKPLQQLDFCFHTQAGKNSTFDIIIWHKNAPKPKEISGTNLALILNDKPIPNGDH